MASKAVAGFFIVAIAFGVGLGAASADAPDDASRAGSFGFVDTSHDTAIISEASAIVESGKGAAYRERSALAHPAPRDINAGLKMVDAMEREERARVIADNAAALKRMAAEKAKQGVEVSPEEVAGTAPNPEAYEYGLPVVDWSVGKQAFVAEWSTRIDEYLEGSPLSGYGAVFAESAWDHGVDPRWSPAISNTESGKGSVCFRSFNAWGWGDSGWEDWETAIRAHVAGLARGYGYSITTAAAQTYCPPTWSDWYAKTLNQMSLI